MSKIATISLIGVSGECYEFGVYPLDHKFPPVAAVYCISKRILSGDNKGTHTSIYVGQTGDLSVRLNTHHQQACLTEHGANCLCLHLDSSEASRLEKKRDLVNALHPTCNDDHNR